jgi:hypothetical protein
MRDAPDETIVQYAKSNHLVLVTRDLILRVSAAIRSYPPSLYQRIVVLNTPQKSDSRTVPSYRYPAARKPLPVTWRIDTPPAGT